MKHKCAEIPQKRMSLNDLSRISKFGMGLVQAVMLGLGFTVLNGQQNEYADYEDGAQVLTRGPVHEAFAGIVSYNPEPGIIVDMAPPDAIEELPPSERPVGDNISWIPGYWAWNDEGGEYLWVSGTWRALPPGRQWNTGYWAQAGRGHQWTSGYWADASARETTYLPRPPATVEVGPNIAAPSRDHVWSPGSWMWQQERYAWRPGYWSEGRSDWDWTPSHYVWTPRGHVYVDGYWDYSMNRRGVLYAPVRFQPGYQSRPGYEYSPVIAIGLTALVDHLFLRPKYNHYYFGDYYDRRYSKNGYYSPHAYQAKRFGYDPVYSYQRWTHRQENDWERRHLASYDYRRDHESARPPRTWSDQRRLKMDKIDAKDRQNYRMATPFHEMARNSDSKMRVQPVTANERKRHADVGREVRKSREQRKALESHGRKMSGEKSEQDMKPAKVKQSSSPIVGRSRDKFAGKEAPPEPHRSSYADNKRDPSDRKEKPDQDRSESKKNQADTRGRNDNKDRELQRNPGQGKSRPESRNDQPNSRRDADSKNKAADLKPKPDKDRADKKNNHSPPRREADPNTKDNERKQSPNKTRTETEKSQPSSRRDDDSKAKDRERREVRRREEEASNKTKEQRKQKRPDDRKKKDKNSSSDKEPDKEDRE